MKQATESQARRLRHKQRSKARAQLCDESFSDLSDDDECSDESSESCESSSQELPRGPNDKDGAGDGGAGASAGVTANWELNNLTSSKIFEA